MQAANHTTAIGTTSNSGHEDANSEHQSTEQTSHTMPAEDMRIMHQLYSKYKQMATTESVLEPQTLQSQKINRKRKSPQSKKINRKDKSPHSQKINRKDKSPHSQKINRKDKSPQSQKFNRKDKSPDEDAMSKPSKILDSDSMTMAERRLQH